MEVPLERAQVARAYVYSGDWVADCPRPGCGNVEHVYRPSRMNGPRDVPLSRYTCSYCGAQAPIDWPDDRLGISAVLSRRPVPSTRNWYPRDHPVAVRFRIEHGQSVRDLESENDAHGVR